MRKTVLTFLLLTFFMGFVYAHGDHKKIKHNKSLDTVTVVSGDTIAVNGILLNDSLKNTKETVEPETIEDFELTATDALFEHIHNKIIHFPIVLIVIAFFFSLLQIKYQKFDPAIKIMVLSAILFSIIAFFTGTNQMEPFEETAKDWLVHLHRTFGITTLVTTVVWCIFLFVNKLKKYAWLLAVIAFLIVSVTGFLGGVLAH